MNEDLTFRTTLQNGHGKVQMPKGLTGRVLDGAMTVHFVLNISRYLATSGIAVHIAHSVD